MENNQSSFWQFSDNLRLQTGNLADLSLNDSIWSTNYAAKRTAAEERRNFDFRSAGNAAYGADLKSDFNLGFNNEAWKAPINDNFNGGGNYSGFGSSATGLNGGFNKGVYSTPSLNFNSFSKGKGFANASSAAPSTTAAPETPRTPPI